MKKNESIVSYVDKVERIYRIFLSLRIKKRTWYRIAKEADVVYSWTDKVLKELESEQIIKGSKLKKPKALFEKWRDRTDQRGFREYHVQNPEKILMETQMEYALTGYFAENLIGHYLFPRYYEFYIRPKDALKWHYLLSKNGYVGKGNVRVILADEQVFFERSKIDNWPVVSIQQLIVDLMREGAECSEAADNLISKVYL